MKIWRRATRAIKDKLTLITTTDEKKFTVAIIKATSPNNLSIDIENVQYINRYIQSNPSSFKPIIRAITLRVEYTRDWTVALKCLMIIHGLFLAGITAVDSIGRLPFDLSGFGKNKSRFSITGRFNVFVRAYFSFLDERSILFFNDANRRRRLEIIVKMQRIVDLLMRIKPISETPLVIEAMEFVIIEILEIYGQISQFLSDVQSNIPGESSEAELAVKIVAKSLSQREEVFKYLEFCRGFGVTNARVIPNFVRFPDSQVILLDKLLRIVPQLERTAAKITPVTAEEFAISVECSSDRSKILENVSRRSDDKYICLRH